MIAKKGKLLTFPPKNNLKLSLYFHKTKDIKSIEIEKINVLSITHASKINQSRIFKIIIKSYALVYFKDTGL